MLSFSARAINSPQIRSVLVQSNGNVNVCWEQPADPLNEFKSYEVFYSATLAGPYSNMASISAYNSPMAICFTCNANTGKYYFYVEVKTQTNTIVPAIDTVSSVFLVLNSPPLSQYANIQWNDFTFPVPAGEDLVFKVWREYPMGNWNQIATKPINTGTVVQNYFHTDTISVCQDSINYRVELFDPVSGCATVSNVKGTTFMDKTRPSAPTLDSVSVNSNGDAIMGISSSYSGDVKCFIVYKDSIGTYWAKDTICTNNLSTLYTYLGSQAAVNSEGYSVAAIDSCGNISQIALNPQNTIYVKVLYDICSKTATLNWNQYINMKGGVAKYEVQYSVNGGPFVNLGDTTVMTYKHKGLVNGNTYCYRIRARNPTNTVTSTSNQFCIIPSLAVTPAFVYLKRVTVINPTGKVNVEWYVDNTVKVGGFEVFHAANYNGPYSSAGTILSTGGSNYLFTDNYVDAATRSYYFKVHALDTCLNEIKRTDTSNTIHLTAVNSGNLTTTLYWTNYGVWPTGVSGYNIYRSLDGNFGAPIATVGGGTGSYLDDVSGYADYSGKFTYYVEATEAAGNPYGFTEISQSNYADVYIDASLFVPNAFVPKGHNKVFLPVLNFVEKTDYKLSIFDRWGTKIFETGDVTEGWDGGKYEEGIFAYLIQYKTSIGEFREHKGTVMLVR